MKVKIFVLCTLLCLTGLSAESIYRFSYKINFIDDILKTAKGNEKVDALLESAGYYMTEFGDMHKGIAYLLEARDLATELKYTEGLLRSYSALGDIYLISEDHTSALDYFSKMAAVLKGSGRVREYAEVLIKMADVAHNSKNFDQSLSFSDSATFYAQKTGYEALLTRSYYFSSLAWRGKFDYMKALEYTQKSMDMAVKQEMKWFLGNCYNATGDLNEMMGNFDIAFDNYKKAAQFYEEYNLSDGMAVVYFNLASMYKVNGDYNKALEYLNLSLKISQDIKNDSMIKDNYLGLFGLYNLLKDFKNANKYYMLLNSFTSQRDSLNIPLSKIEIDYEISKKDVEKEILGLKLDEERHMRYIYAAIFVLLLSVTYFLFYRKLKQKKINELKLEERRISAELSSLQSKINPHFLFNAISSITELINIDPASAKKMLQNISGLLRYTLRTSKNDFVQLDEEILMIRKYLEIEKIRFGKRLDYVIDVPDNLSNMLIPPLLIQPLAENSIKHGLSNRLDGGKVSITAYENMPGRVTITVEDNGVSKEEGSKPEGNGIGLSSVKERLQLVYKKDYSFRIEKENGYKVIIVIPKKI
ncbi:MAG TPA: histidine kinase [Clostridiales bacterium]|nr:histidine kinase [Clostridiales bacterium]HQP69639.1 histidine kinase [Clostridiales bacterium]